MKNVYRLATAGAVLGGTLATAAGASAAPTLSAPLAPCYTAVPPKGVPSIPVSISGGGPNDQFVLEISDPKGGTGSLGSTEGSFDGNGNGSATLTDVYPAHGSIYPIAGSKANVSVTDTMPDGTQPDFPLGSTLITNSALDLGFDLTAVNAVHPITVSGTQFANKALYGFVVHNGRVTKRISLGKGNVCGYAKRKYALVTRHEPQGKYILYVNAGKTLNKKAALSRVYKVETF